MRNSWIISFAAVCGVAAFIYTIAVGNPRRRQDGSWAGAGSSNTRAVEPPDNIEGLEERIESNARAGRTPHSGRWHFRLARLYEEAGRAEDARRTWEDTARMRLAFAEQRRDRPESADAWFEAGWALWKLGRLEEAQEPLEMAERHFSDRSALPHDRRTDEAWHRLAWARKLMGQDVEAAIAWARARDLVSDAPPWNAGALYNLACYLALLGEREGAFSALDRAVAAGWGNAARALHDEDLESLRDDPRFKDLLERMRAAPTGIRVGPG